MDRKESLSTVGSLFSAVLASSCCWLPLLLLALGVGGTAVGSLTRTIERFRPVFGGAAILLLGTAFYFTYFRRRADRCCADEPESPDAACSCCGQKGKRVPSATVRALVKDSLRGAVSEGDYVLCLNPGCAQVYTGPSGARSFVKSDLSVRVGYKEQEGPHLVCYCFEHSAEEIEEELRSTGKTTVPDRIRIEVKKGRCECEIRNPQGTCCLGSVNRAVKDAEARIQGGFELSIGAPLVQCAPSPPSDAGHEDCCRLPRTPRSLTGRLRRVNKVILPILSVLVLATLFFPDKVFGFLSRSERQSSAVDRSGTVVVLHVPGMT